MKKFVTVILITALTLCGCTSQVPQASAETPAVIFGQDEITIHSTTDDEVVPEPTATHEDVSGTKSTLTDIDLSSYFGSTDGVAVFLSSDNHEYIYNDSLANTRFSPYSTFKIVSTLMGLNEGIISGKESTMSYDGSTYWHEPWNDNVNLESAFKNSCVWYYHQIIYQIPQQSIQEQLNALQYGNCDISQWEGNGSNSKADLNGFWLNSSLKISPKEQVHSLKRVIENDTMYAPKHIELLKDLMDTQNLSIHAKTGSGSDESWYVGYFEHDDKLIYFATFIQGDDVSGSLSREISERVIENWSSIANAN